MHAALSGMENVSNLFSDMLKTELNTTKRRTRVVRRRKIFKEEWTPTRECVGRCATVGQPARAITTLAGIGLISVSSGTASCICRGPRAFGAICCRGGQCCKCEEGASIGDGRWPHVAEKEKYEISRGIDQCRSSRGDTVRYVMVDARGLLRVEDSGRRVVWIPDPAN